MTTNKVYNNPPIKEAIITISFNKPMDLNVINRFVTHAVISKNYPVQKPLFHYSVNVDASKGKSSVSELMQGYNLECGEQCFKIIKITSSQIALHNFTNYIGWNDMQIELTEICSIVFGMDDTLKIQDLNVRYVNQINIPIPLENGLEHFLTILPTIPPNGKPLDNFFIQLQNTNEDNSLQSILNQTIIHKNENNLTVLLDIAVSKNNISNLASTFNSIRIFKNELFESALTSYTKQLFN
jgi:uncharacterized protein (TIGR04255 family)